MIKYIWQLLIGLAITLLLYSNFWNKEEMENPSLQSFGPATEYLFDKCGLPSEENLQFREKQFEIITQQNKYRSSPGNFPGNWEVQGPTNISGRITSIAVNPKNEKIIYVGFAEGGVFKTTDGGNNWIPIFDNQTMLSIGCIAIDPLNTEILYVGTGDPNNGGSITAGNGLYKSTDGGKTWKISGLQLCRNISNVSVDALNPNIINVAALGNPFELNEHKGIYKSKDGGNSWTKTLFIANGVGFIDLIVDPNDPNVLYTSSYDRWLTNSGFSYGGENAGVYKSIDKGESWKKLSNALPQGKWGRVNLSISKNNNSVIYLSYIKYDTSNNSGPYDLGGIRISRDKGNSWTETQALDPNSGLDPLCLGGFGWYFGKVIANPKNENDLYLLGIDLWRSFNAGKNWILAAPEWWTYEVHADKHDIAFLKDNSFLLATDGGLYHSDEFNSTWTDMDNIPCAQFYRVTCLDNYTNDYFGGAQDNGSMYGNKDGIDNWTKILGGDGFQVQGQKGNSNQLFGETQNGSIWNLQNYENIAEQLPGTKNWDMPYFLSAFNDSKLVAGTDHVYEKNDFAIGPWKEISNSLTSGTRYPTRKTPTITTLDESTLDSNIIIAGTTNGFVWLREKASELQWKDITSNLPLGYITSVKNSKEKKNRLYVTLSTKQKNDYSPFVYRSKNNGQTWESIQSDLPMFPVYDIFVYPNRHDSILFVATDIGVFATINAGISWQRLGDNMPYIPVFDLDLNTNSKELVAGTFARAIQTFKLDKLLNTNILNTNNQIATEEISVFPNPCHDYLNLQLNDKINSNRKVQIINLKGNLVKEVSYSPLENSILKIDVRELEVGIYFVKIIGRTSGKIIKI
ncbi:MAG: T9SS type A sorting domain-containing protein [Saprospiraceae bacterium]